MLLQDRFSSRSRTVPHESVIDAILHPEIRDRMILLRGRFDLVDCLHDYRLSVKIHGDDVLSHVNWEISVSDIIYLSEANSDNLKGNLA